MFNWGTKSQKRKIDAGEFIDEARKVPQVPMG